MLCLTAVAEAPGEHQALHLHRVFSNNTVSTEQRI